MAAACGGSEKVPTSPGREGLAVVCGGSEVVPTSSWGETLAVVCGVSKVVPTSPEALMTPRCLRLIWTKRNKIRFGRVHGRCSRSIVHKIP